MNKKGYVYIMTNQINEILYTGVTSDLIKRVQQHKDKMVGGFTKKYNLNKLVYYEISDSIEGAIIREKQIKGGSRNKKLELIKFTNPNFEDIYKILL